MRWAPFLVGGAVAALALRARAQRREPRVITLDPIDIYGRVPPSDSSTPAPSETAPVPRLRPLRIRFDVRISPIEKWAVSPAVVRQTVEANANTGLIPGVGIARVTVGDIETGYVVSVAYPDSRSDISAMAAQRAIESLDPRLKGRIANVVVSR